MSRWVAHNGTYRCPEHPKLTARAKRYRAFDDTAPRCPTCREPMKLVDRP